MDTAADPDRVFRHLLANVLGVSVVNFTVWFALTFWVYLETRSVVASGVIAGLFLAGTVLSGVWFGSLVDHHRKRAVLQVSSLASLLAYAAGLTLYLVTPAAVLTDPASVRLWLLVGLLMAGVVVGNVRGIALTTLVTVLFAEDRRERANGLVGTVSGVTFVATSVVSGVLVAWNGMLGVLLLGAGVLAAALVHLARVRFPDAAATVAAGDGDGSRGVDLRGTLRVVRGVPGLVALLAFSAMNNLLGGVFVALEDPYGLSMVSVQVWGLLWGGISAMLIVGGLVISRKGLPGNPVRVILLVNLAMWTITLIFPLRDSIVWYAAGLVVYMFLVPFVEAAEQTVFQKVVPYERQGRVFGFAQAVEQSASPVTAVLISPVAQFVFIPFMTDGAGARTLGPWFGTGADRGLALVFVAAALVGIAVTVVALRSRYYRQLRDRVAARVTADPVPTQSR